MMNTECPVCKAGFRGTRKCTRCGADLSNLMTIAAAARLYRNKARTAIKSRDFAKAHDLAADAQRLHATETGRRLLLFTEWLYSDLTNTPEHSL